MAPPAPTRSHRTQDRTRFLAHLREEDTVWRVRVERLGIRLDE